MFVDLFLMINMTYSTDKTGFTIIEIMVTVSILAILMATVISGFGPAREQARDAQRQADMRTMEVALTLYKNKYGQYPAGCNGFTDTLNNPVWSGQADSVDHACTDGTSQYIRGLVPEFLPELPVDPRLNGDDSGYVYTTNEDQSVYKFMALNTVETEEVAEGHQFFRCGEEYRGGSTGTGGNGSGASNQDTMICLRVPPNLSDSASAYNPGPAWSPFTSVCRDVNQYQTTYAVSAGFSDDARGLTRHPDKGREYDTEIVRCG